MVTAATVTQMASQYFAGPLGLAALASLIPLIIFYLVKPKPEEQVMPSMMFFMEQKEPGKVSQAIQSLVKNLLLLLHILIVIGMAAAIAQPLMPGLDSPEDTVIVFDRSASMEDDFDTAKNYVRSNLGQENTLIVVDSGVSVPLEQASAREVRNYVNGLQTRDVETDVLSALETVPDYDGNVYIASDLSQTVNEQSAEPAVEALKNERDVSVMDAESSNKWGIVEVNPSRGNSTVEIKNFQEREVTLTVNTGDGTRDIEIDGEEVEPMEIETGSGTTTVSLEEDPVAGDNKAFISIPSRGSHEITFIADEENQYFREAVNAIPTTSFEYRRPPIEDEIDADIYVVGKTNRILEGTAQEIQSQVRNGKSLVLFGQPGLKDKGFTSAPADLGARRNATVEIREPIRATVGSTEIYQASNVKGSSLSSPPNAMLKRNLGQGEVFLYNIQDEDFHFDFLYPVFWKNVFQDLTDSPTVEELNRRTGATLNASGLQTPDGRQVSGQVTAYRSGYYNSSAETFAVNMESEPESGSEPVEVEESQNLGVSSKRNVQNLAAVFLAVIVLMEMLYLMWIGEL